MDEIELRQDFAPYVNGFGLVDASIQPAPPAIGNSGNSILFHAHYCWTLRRRGFWIQSDMENADRAVSSCEVLRGLIARAPSGFNFTQDQEGPDDQIGYISMSAADPRLTFADRWLEYGRKVRAPLRDVLLSQPKPHPWLARLFGWVKLRYVFNNKIPGTLVEWKNESSWQNWEAWIGRFPQVIAHAQFAANERPWIGRRIWWALSVWQTARFWDKEGTDQWILTWHLVQTFRASGEKCIFCDWASKNFTERLFTKFPGGLSSIFARYFGEAHPITRYFLP